MSPSPSETRDRLAELRHTPRKQLGQNFLIDGNLVRKSIHLGAVEPGDRVVEIGPGLGTLTHAILDAGAKVWAIEQDPTLAGHLRKSLDPATRDRLHLLTGDCLEQPLAGLPPESAAADFKIIANLPYAISTPWMDAVLQGPSPGRMVLMLQREAAERYTAPSGGKAFGPISIRLQSAYTVRARHRVSAACFYPRPRIDSQLLCLERRPDALFFAAAARDFMRRIFTQRRKQLRALVRRDPLPGAQAWFASLPAQGIPSDIRPEDLAIGHWQTLPHFLSSDAEPTISSPP